MEEPDDVVWQNLCDYAAKVQSVGLPLPGRLAWDFGHLLDVETVLVPLERHLRISSCATPARTLFPHLSHVVFHYKWCDERYARLILCPHLRSLHLPVVPYMVRRTAALVI